MKTKVYTRLLTVGGKEDPSGAYHGQPGTVLTCHVGQYPVFTAGMATCDVDLMHEDDAIKTDFHFKSSGLAPLIAGWVTSAGGYMATDFQVEPVGNNL
jgi:hypothetical protein